MAPFTLAVSPTLKRAEGTSFALLDAVDCFLARLSGARWEGEGETCSDE